MRLKAGFERAYAVLGAAERSQRDGRQCAAMSPLPFAQFTDQAYTVLDRHGKIGDEDVGARAFVIREQVERFARGAEGRHPRPAQFQHCRNQRERVSLVVHDDRPEPR